MFPYHSTILGVKLSTFSQKHVLLLSPIYAYKAHIFAKISLKGEVKHEMKLFTNHTQGPTPWGGPTARRSATGSTTSARTQAQTRVWTPRLRASSGGSVRRMGPRAWWWRWTPPQPWLTWHTTEAWRRIEVCSPRTRR